MRAILVLATLLITAGYALGEARPTSAGVDRVAVGSATCVDGKINAAINWPSTNQGTQWVYWSLQNNGWLAGTYATHGPLGAGVSSTNLVGLPPNTQIYLMVGTVVGGQLDVGRTMVFTSPSCSGAAVQGPVAQGPGPFHPNLFQGICPLLQPGFGGHLPFHGTFGPFSGFDFDDDEDDDEDEDEDESDEDDEDEVEDGDEDEDEDEDESDEDDEDEDDEGFFFNRDLFDDDLLILHPGLLNICFPQHGPFFQHGPFLPQQGPSGGHMANWWNY